MIQSNMKNRWLFKILIISIIGVIWGACESDKTATPPSGAVSSLFTVKVTNGKGNTVRMKIGGEETDVTVTEVRAFLPIKDGGGWYPWHYDRSAPGLASGTYADGGFIIQLPEFIEEDSLSPLINKDVMQGLEFFPFFYNPQTISDPHVKGAAFDFLGYDEYGVPKDTFRHHECSWPNDPGIMANVSYVYVNSDVTIVASNCFIFFEKGWNIVYFINPNGRAYTQAHESGNFVV